jgi:hypothetical protein
MTRIFLDLPPEVHEAVLKHLLPDPPESEQAAFIFTNAEVDSGDQVFRHLEWLPVEAYGLEVNSPHYLELTDNMRAKVIKRAHDLSATIVEFHSHLGPWPASFSESDRAGFEEFVPHVWWRLKGRGYVAVVVTQSDFDALAWLSGPHTPEPLTAIRSAGRIHHPTAITLKRWKEKARDSAL